MTNDILLDNGKCIQWIEIDGSDTENVFAVDHLLELTFNFWKGLETQCLAECCGVDAFSFDQATIRNAANGTDKRV